MRRMVRNIDNRRTVRDVKIPEGVTIIDEGRLYDIIDEIMSYHATKENMIDMTKIKFKSIIYDIVINYFKKHKLFFKGLNLNIIYRQINRLEGKYKFEDTDKDKMSEEEEYDQLCRLKANGLEYSIGRFNELKRRLSEE